MTDHVVHVPDIGEGVAEVEIVEWLVSVGDTVDVGTPIAEIMTDKATVEVPAPCDGTIGALCGVAGELLAVGSELARITQTPFVEASELETSEVGATPVQATRGGSHKSDTTGDSNSIDSGSMPKRDGNQHVSEPEPMAGSRRRTPSRAKVLASPSVRTAAHKSGIDLRLLTGTGEGGRITHADLDAYDGRAAISPTSSVDEITSMAIRGVRRVIANRLQDTWQRVPHITYVEEVDVSQLESLRSELNKDGGRGGIRITLLPFIIAAIVASRSGHPHINAHYDDDAEILNVHSATHVGIATNTSDGLIVPVISDAQNESIWTMAERVSELASRARTKQLRPNELGGSTITVSSLGALGGVATTPILNRPEVAIIGVNKIASRPVAVNDRIEVRKLMNLSASFDHRIVDGADAALYVQNLRRHLENPVLLFVGQPDHA